MRGEEQGCKWIGVRIEIYVEYNAGGEKGPRVEDSINVL